MYKIEISLKDLTEDNVNDIQRDMAIEDISRKNPRSD